MGQNIKTQKCTKCLKDFLLNSVFFHKKSSAKSGFRKTCKACRKLDTERYYDKNKAEINKKNRDRRSDLIRNDEDFYKRERIRAAEYRKNNSKKITEYNKKYIKKRSKTDKAFVLKNRIYKSINKSLSRDKSGAKKKNSIWNNLPYTSDELKIYLERKFEDKMTWDNYGDYWVIDHIIPQAALPFDNFSDSNFIKCWSLYNLRPLERKINQNKSSVFLGIRYDKYSPNDASKFILKPWGAELIWTKTKKYVGKILFVTKNSRLSLQYHNYKEETMYVKSGIIKIYHGSSRDHLTETILTENDSFHIPPKTIHRVEALTDSEIFEVSTTELEDVVRISDDYKRIK